MNVEASNELSRCIIYDRAFRNNLHVDEALFIFAQTREDGASHESGVLRRLAPAANDVHRIGCAIAHAQNARKQFPPPGPNRRYYCGFRTATVSDLQLIGPGYEVTLTMDNEGEEPAHVDIALLVSATSKNERATIRTDAGLSLAEAFGPAEGYICEVDRGDHQHPLVKYPDCLSVDLSSDGLLLNG